jgi:hypothetical protein
MLNNFHALTVTIVISFHFLGFFRGASLPNHSLSMRGGGYASQVAAMIVVADGLHIFFR